MLLRIKANGELVVKVTRITAMAQLYIDGKAAISIEDSLGTLDSGCIFYLAGVRYDKAQNEPLQPGDWVTLVGSGKAALVVDRKAMNDIGFNPKHAVLRCLPVCILTGPNAGNVGWMAENALEEVKS